MIAELPEAQLLAATAIAGVGPAYEALLAEAQVDAGVRYGLPPALAAQLVAETKAGTAALLAARGYDTPGGPPRGDLSGGQYGAWARRARAGRRAGRVPGCDRCGGEPGCRSVIVLALTRGDIANYVDALFEVYILLILLYILFNLLFSFGVRLPYSRWTDVLLGFLRDVSEPYLRLFRRFIPPIGMIDLSPMIGIFLLIIVRTIIVGAISG